MSRYSPRVEPPAPAVYWRPGAMAAPKVAYPAPAGAAPVSRPSAPRSRPAPAIAPQTTPEQHFGVNTGGWSSAMPRGWNEAGPLNPAIIKNHTINMGGGGGGYMSPNDVVSQFKEMMDRANQANEARYQDVLGGYQSRYERGLDLLKGLGQQEGRDINEIYDNQAAATKQRLIDRGILSSSVLDTMLSGVDRERAADLGRLNDRVRQQALTTDAGLSGDTLQFMERKDENGPQMQLLAQLMSQLGQGGLGGGVGGGYAGAPIMGGMEVFNPYAGVLNKAAGIRNLNAMMAMGRMGSTFGNIRNANDSSPHWRGY